MRNVPDLRFDGFDGEWDSRRLKSLIEDIGTGSSKFNFIEGRYPILGSTGIIGYDNQFDYDGKFILIARVGANAGILYKYNGKVKISDNTIFIKTKNQEYIYNLLLKKDLTRLVFGSGQPLVKSSDLKDLHVIYTKNEKEQDKIGELFRKIDALIEIQEGKVAKMEDFKKSMLQKMFPKKDELVPEFRFDGFDGEWKENKLSEIGDTYTSLSGKTAEDFGHGEASYVTYMNVYKNSIADINDLGSIEIDNKQNEVLNGDFFFTTSSETPEEVGLSSAWIYDKSNVYLNSFCFGFRPIININTSFFAYFFRSEYFRRKVVMLAQGSTRFNISKKYMMDILVRYPSLEEQEKIGQFFKNLDTQIETEEKLLESYKMMKKSLLQKMFV